MFNCRCLLCVLQWGKKTLALELAIIKFKIQNQTTRPAIPSDDSHTDAFTNSKTPKKKKNKKQMAIRINVKLNSLISIYQKSKVQTQMSFPFCFHYYSLYCLNWIILLTIAYSSILPQWHFIWRLRGRFWLCPKD